MSGPQGFTLWFTGLSGAGKSTLSQAIAAELARRGLAVERLDGDEVRQRLSKGLGFSQSDRNENVPTSIIPTRSRRWLSVTRTTACTTSSAVL